MNNIQDKFLNWEKESGIYQVKYDGFAIWHLVRVSVFMAIVKKDFKFEQIRRETKQLENKIGYIKVFYILKNVFIFLIKILKRGNIDILIISKSENRFFFDGSYVDKYFDNIGSVNKKIRTLELPDTLNPNLHYENGYKKEQVIPADIIYVLETLNKKFNKKSIDTDEIYILLNKFIQENFQEKINLELFNKNVKRLIERHINRRKIFKYILKIIKPKMLILKSSYDPMSQFFIYYSNCMNIKTVELQHGHIYSNHPGYMKPIISNEFIEKIYPNSLLVENKYYKDILLKNGWKENELYIVGNIVNKKSDINKKNFNALKAKVNNYDNIVTIINQHTLSKEIAEVISEIDTMKNYFFIIKLHPRLQTEQKKYFRIFEHLKNVIIIGDENTLEECFNVSTNAIGVYSTGVVDALKLGLKVDLLNLPGVDFLNDLIKDSIVNKINKITEINSLTKSKQEIFTVDFSVDKINKTIESIK